MKKFVALLGMMCSLSACATILSGTSTNANLAPSDGGYDIKAEVVTGNGVQQVNLPATVVLTKGNQPITINIKGNQCYYDSSFVKNPTMNFWVLVNLFISGGTTGTTSDAVSGALWTYDESIIVPVSKKDVCR